MASTKYPCYIEFSDSGKVARLVHKNGALLAVFLIHGTFADRTFQMHTHACSCGHASNSHLLVGVKKYGKCELPHCDCGIYTETRVMPFEAELWGLAEYEEIDQIGEVIKDK